MGCGGLGLRTPGLYQPSNLRIAAVIRPETVPARMSAANCFTLSGCAVGFDLRRFFVPLAMFTTPFLIIIIYLCEYICKMGYCTNLHKYICAFYILAQVQKSGYNMERGGETMEEKKGKAATRAKNKYNAANYDRLSPFVRKGKKERYKEAATAAGYSLNEFMEKAMDKLAAEILGA